MKKNSQVSKFYLSLAFFVAILLLTCLCNTQEVNANSYQKLTVGKTISQSYEENPEYNNNSMTIFTYTFTPSYTGSYSIELNDPDDNSTGVLYSPSNDIVNSLYNWDDDYSYYSLTKDVTYQYQVSVDTDWDSGSFTITTESHIPVFIQENDTSCRETVIAVGTTKSLNLENASFTTNQEWTSSKSSVATVSNKGVITAKKAGRATITVSGKDLYGMAFSDEFTITVSNPKLSSTSIGLNIYQAERSSNKTYQCDNNSITLKGLQENSTVRLTSSSKNLICEHNDLTNHIVFYPKKTGTYTVKVTIDGKKFTINVSVQKLYFARNSKTIADGINSKSWSKTWISEQSMIALYQGETTTLTLKGKPEKSTATYKSSNTSVATVNNSGKITAKGLGYATITATVDGISITYKVGVSYKVAIKALRYAAKHYGSVYSQSKRMKNGYYDCSSYVWRSFANAGLYLKTKNYAPTAADLGKWCHDKGYIILSGTVNIQKLLPGDLIFWIGTKKNGHINGRYRNIYHVEMYQGMNRAITVDSQKYYSNTSYEIIVARPWDTTAGDLKVTTSGKNKLKLTWSNEFGANGYQIYRSTSKKGTYKKIATVKNARSYIDTISNTKKTYYYKVRAYWKSSEKTYYSKFSSVVSKK